MTTPTLLIGPPGCGKTSWAKAQAEKRGLPLIEIPLADRDPVEIAGAAVPDLKRGCVRWLDSEHLIMAKEQPVVVFLDELTTATRSQRVSALRWADPSTKLHPQTLVIAACNPPEYAAGAAEPLTPPELNRFWIKRMDAEQAIVWLCGQSGTVGEVGRYLRANPQSALASPEAIQRAYEEQSPYPTPRSWHLAAQKWDEEHTDEAWSGLVGAAAAAQFLHWRQANDLPNPADILAGATLDVPKETSGALATATAIVGLWINGDGKSGGDKTLNNVVKWFRLAAEAGHAGIVSRELGRLMERLVTLGKYKYADGLIKDGAELEAYGKLVRGAKQ